MHLTTTTYHTPTTTTTSTMHPTTQYPHHHQSQRETFSRVDSRSWFGISGSADDDAEGEMRVSDEGMIAEREEIGMTAKMRVRGRENERGKDERRGAIEFVLQGRGRDKN
ncbi:hypothetical protein Pcinc_040579 [Petrolisthes cinctipes]|uniref:Uncharacterized protein n=1 Tax=Petrolisthes cinctipes TaxID=88211 RepID=A0AAE1BLZ7_PETCI|nr:hypothetical protein Pcinc_040579 [Petrolisthes cinctipes]